MGASKRDGGRATPVGEGYGRGGEDELPAWWCLVRRSNTVETVVSVYREAVLDEDTGEIPTVDEDPHCLGRLKNYRSLMLMAQEAHLPMFLLRSADGAIGAHQTAVRAAWRDFEHLARSIAAATGLMLPEG